MLKPRVIVSFRAFSCIISNAETAINCETGGILLGFYSNGTFYVLEATAPGPNAVLEPACLTTDSTYINYEIHQISNIYADNIEIIGVWHKHNNCLNPPFSVADMETHKTLSASCGKNILSLLLQDLGKANSFRLSAYEYLKDSDKTTLVEFEIRKINNPPLTTAEMLLCLSQDEITD